MRTIEAALWPLKRPQAQLGVGVFLGEEYAPDLAGLADGERVVLIEPNELRAEATVRLIELSGRKFWFGEIGDPAAIEVIYPDPTPHSSLV